MFWAQPNGTVKARRLKWFLHDISGLQVDSAKTLVGQKWNVLEQLCGMTRKTRETRPKESDNYSIDQCSDPPDSENCAKRQVDPRTDA